MRVTRAEINSQNLTFNLHNIRKTAPNSEILAVVKANAYGHGAIGIARLLREMDVNYLGVAFADEGWALRKSGDTGNIVVMVPGTGEDAEVFAEFDLQTCAADLDVLSQYSDTALKHNTKIKTHLFINTGMNRDGVKPHEAEDFLIKAKKLPGIEIIGILTHFASSDFLDKSFAHNQLQTFINLIDELKQKGHDFQFIHCANSGAIANIPEAHFNMIRPGISLYGYMPEERLSDRIELKPVMELKTEVVSIKRVKAGETAGYSFKYFAEDELDLAIIPIGYGDGLNYSFTNRVKVLINGKFYPLVGSICMDQSIVELGRDSNVKVGDEVVMIGEQQGAQQTAYDLAKIIETIPYDITTSISMRVPRLIK